MRQETLMRLKYSDSWTNTNFYCNQLYNSSICITTHCFNVPYMIFMFHKKSVLWWFLTFLWNSCVVVLRFHCELFCIDGSIQDNSFHSIVQYLIIYCLFLFFGIINKLHVCVIHTCWLIVLANFFLPEMVISSKKFSYYHLNIFWSDGLALDKQ